MSEDRRSQSENDTLSLRAERGDNSAESKTEDAEALSRDRGPRGPVGPSLGAMAFGPVADEAAGLADENDLESDSEVDRARAAQRQENIQRD
jgi:hypothetical protein